MVLATAFVLLLLAFDIETVQKGIPFDFRHVAALGVIIVLLSGIGVTVLGQPFLQQSYMHIHLPIYGTIELTTVTIFETGVALTVVGVVVTIIVSISKDVEEMETIMIIVAGVLVTVATYLLLSKNII